MRAAVSDVSNAKNETTPNQRLFSGEEGHMTKKLQIAILSEDLT